jgi:hypothetical protein
MIVRHTIGFGKLITNRHHICYGTLLCVNQSLLALLVCRQTPNIFAEARMIPLKCLQAREGSDCLELLRLSAHFGENAQLKRWMPHTRKGKRTDSTILHQVFGMER